MGHVVAGRSEDDGRQVGIHEIVDAGHFQFVSHFDAVEQQAQGAVFRRQGHVVPRSIRQHPLFHRHVHNDVGPVTRIVMQKSVPKLRKERNKQNLNFPPFSSSKQVVYPQSGKVVVGGGKEDVALFGHGPETDGDGIVEGNGFDANVAAADQVMAHQSTAVCFPLPFLRSVVVVG